MHISERSFLLDHTNKKTTPKLSVIFAIICIIDVFGVFPVVALPKTIIDCGFYAILVVATVSSIQIYTAILLGKCWMIVEKIDLSIKDKNRYPYAALAEVTFGNGFSNFVSLLVNVTIFCGGIPNLIVASQNLQLLGLRLSDGNIDVPFCYWIIVIGMILCPVLWLGSPKDMKLICSLSVCLVILVFCLVFGCLIFVPSSPTPTTNSQSLWELIFISYGVITFQYDIHPSVLTIQIDMKDKFKINSAILGGFAVSLSMFLTITVLAALKFGESTKPSLLETLPTTFPLHFAAFFVAIQLCLSLAVSNSALFQHVEDCMSIPRDFNQRRCILRTTLTLLAILIAESVPRFDLVMSLIGGTLTGPLMFILPPLFYLKVVYLESKKAEHVMLETFDGNPPVITFLSEAEGFKSLKRKLEAVLCISIVIASAFCTVATTYVNLKNAVTFLNFSQPCIVNITDALINL